MSLQVAECQAISFRDTFPTQRDVLPKDENFVVIRAHFRDNYGDDR